MMHFKPGDLVYVPKDYGGPGEHVIGMILSINTELSELYFMSNNKDLNDNEEDEEEVVAYDVLMGDKGILVYYEEYLKRI